MRQRVGEFLVAAAGTMPDLERQLVAEAYLGVLENQLSQAAERHRIKEAKSAQGDLRTFENVLLRYRDPRQWRNYLKALGKRKKWWHEEDECPASHAPTWVNEAWKWLPDKEGNWPEGNSTSETLKAARQRLKASLYGQDRTSYLSPPLVPEAFNDFLDTLMDRLHVATCREFLCRWIGGALYVQS